MSQMQATQLTDLPNEILLEVFKHFDVKSLLESSLVCKKWNEIIGLNSTLMKKINLAITNEGDIQMLPEKFTRRYQAGRVDGLGTGIWKLLEHQAPHFQTFGIYNCTIREDDKEDFNKFFGSLSKLEWLCIYESECDIDLSNLNNLKWLTLQDDIEIQKFPESAQLTTLEMVNLKIANSTELLIDFLASQRSLKDLTILYVETANDNINLETLKSIQFPLKNLTIRGDNFFGSEENLLIFMNKFVNSLEDLSVGHEFSAIYEIIFSKFHNLKTLDINLQGAQPEVSFYSRLCPNRSVQQLTVYVDPEDNLIDLTSFKEFIRKLPNLQSLVLAVKNIPKETLMFIANNLEKLEDLVIPEICNQGFEEVNIPSLKKIYISERKRIKLQHWKQMVRAMPNITEFKIDDYCGKLLNTKNINIIGEGWAQLKHITFGEQFVASKKMLTLLLSKCKNLKTVTINNRSAFKSESVRQEILRDVKRDGFSFIF